MLTDDPINFNNIPNEYKVLIGFDNIEFLQSFETVIYLYKIEKTKNSFNDFVKSNLKSELLFNRKNKEEQIDILNTYWDYLEKLSHKEDRVIAFVLYICLKHVERYIDRYSFIFYSRKSIRGLLSKAMNLNDQYHEIIPDSDFFQQAINGGIQKIIKDDISPFNQADRK